MAPWLNAMMETEPFLKINLDAILIALSDAYEYLTDMNVLQGLTCSYLQGEWKAIQGWVVEKGNKKGISAQSFERKTTKYWVRTEDLMTVKMAIVKVMNSHHDYLFIFSF